MDFPSKIISPSFGFNKPINKLQDDIIINNLSIQKGKPKQYKSNPFDQGDISLQFLPKNNSQVIPITSRDTILNNNNSFRLKSMSQELMDKDEELQKYKNEIYQLQEDLNKIKVDKGKINIFLPMLPVRGRFRQYIYKYIYIYIYHYIPL